MLHVGSQHEHTVELRIGGHLVWINGKAMARGYREEAAIAGIGYQCLVTLFQLALQAGDQSCARLFFVAADHIAPAGDFDILHRQIGLAFLARDGGRHHNHRNERL